MASLRSRIKGKVVITDTPGRSVADEEAAGADVVLYYGLSLYAGYQAVKSALDDFKRTRERRCGRLRTGIAEFERVHRLSRIQREGEKYGLA